MSAHIAFLPVCSNCGSVIYDVIRYSQSEPVIKHGDNMVSYYIDPPICKECGAVFEKITLPTRLPFDNMRRLSYETD